MGPRVVEIAGGPTDPPPPPPGLGITTGVDTKRLGTGRVREKPWHVFSILKLELKSVPWTLAGFRHNRIVQSRHEDYFNVCRQHREK